MASKIFGHEPLVSEFGSAINVTFQNGEKMVSLALDDSCGRMDVLGRGSIALFRQKDFKSSSTEATEEVFRCDREGELVPNTLDNFNKAMQWLNRVEYGFEAQATSSFRCSER
ncbi:MAG: hypothetical protein QF412_00305 [Planctomycetota bacterium]|nr:hypothetical protein [Planctomycetota bacterium]